MLCPAATLSVTVKVPLRDPLTVGANVTEIVQLVAGASTAGQLLIWENAPEFAPVTAMPPMLRGV